MSLAVVPGPMPEDLLVPAIFAFFENAGEDAAQAISTFVEIAHTNGEAEVNRQLMARFGHDLNDVDIVAAQELPEDSMYPVAESIDNASVSGLVTMAMVANGPALANGMISFVVKRPLIPLIKFFRPMVQIYDKGRLNHVVLKYESTSLMCYINGKWFGRVSNESMRMKNRVVKAYVLRNSKGDTLGRIYTEPVNWFTSKAITRVLEVPGQIMKAVVHSKDSCFFLYKKDGNPCLRYERDYFQSTIDCAPDVPPFALPLVTLPLQ